MSVFMAGCKFHSFAEPDVVYNGGVDRNMT